MIPVKDQNREDDVLYKVFICGVEVTDLSATATGTFQDGELYPSVMSGTGSLVSRVDITVDKGVPQKATITLNCPNDELIMTDQDIDTVVALRNSFSYQGSYTTRIKQMIVGSKVFKTFVDRFGNEQYLYSFEGSESCLHFFDLVRVFVYSSTSSSWYYQFTGVITKITVSTTLDGVKTISLTCESALVYFKRANLSNSLGYLENTELKKMIEAGSEFYAANAKLGLYFPQAQVDFSIMYANFDFNITFFDALTQIVYGDISQKDYGQALQINASVFGNTVSYSRNHFATGRFDYKKSYIGILGKGALDVKDTLTGAKYATIKALDTSLGDGTVQDWLKILDMEVKSSDLIDLTLSEFVDHFDGETNFLKNLIGDKSIDSLTQEEIVHLIGTNPDIYGLDFGGLKVLIPGSLTGDLEKTLLQVKLNDMSRQANFVWYSKLGILQSVVERVNSLVYDTPKGDIIVEFPLFDAQPSDFGDEYEEQYKVYTDDVTSDIRVTFDSDLIKDVFGAIPSIVATDIQVSNNVLTVDPIIDIIDKFIPLVGISFLRIDLPDGLCTKETAPQLLKLKASLAIRDVKGFDVTRTFSPVQFLNKPIYVQLVDKIGWCVRVVYSIVQESDFTCTLSLAAIRSYSGIKDAQGDKVYDSIAGVKYKEFGSFILDYTALFGRGS